MGIEDIKKYNPKNIVLFSDTFRGYIKIGERKRHSRQKYGDNTALVIRDEKSKTTAVDITDPEDFHTVIDYLKEHYDKNKLLLRTFDIDKDNTKIYEKGKKEQDNETIDNLVKDNWSEYRIVGNYG